MCFIITSRLQTVGENSLKKKNIIEISFHSSKKLDLLFNQFYDSLGFSFKKNAIIL